MATTPIPTSNPSTAQETSKPHRQRPLPPEMPYPSRSNILYRTPSLFPPSNEDEDRRRANPGASTQRRGLARLLQELGLIG